MTKIKVQEGDIAVARGLGDGLEIVLIFGVYDDHADCMLTTLWQELATEVDPILTPKDTGLSDTMVVHTMTMSHVEFDRLSSPIAHCSTDVLDAIYDFWFFRDNDQYKTGDSLMPFCDPRDKTLRHLYKSFREEFSPVQ